MWEGELPPPGERVAGLGQVHLPHVTVPRAGRVPCTSRDGTGVVAGAGSTAIRAGVGLPGRPPSQESMAGGRGCKPSPVKWKLDLYSQFSTLHDSPSHAEGNPSSLHDPCRRLWGSRRPLSAFTSHSPPPSPQAQGPHSPRVPRHPVNVLTRSPVSVWPPSTSSRSLHTSRCGRGLPWPPSAVRPALPSASLFVRCTSSSLFRCLPGGTPSSAHHSCPPLGGRPRRLAHPQSGAWRKDASVNICWMNG